eukprot:g18761.t1
MATSKREVSESMQTRVANYGLIREELGDAFCAGWPKHKQQKTRGVLYEAAKTLSGAFATKMVIIGTNKARTKNEVGVLGAHLNKPKGKGARATASSARAINANRVERLLQDSLQLDDEVREIAKGVDDVVDITEGAEDTRLYSVPVVVDIEDEEQKNAVTALKNDVLALKGMVAALVQYALESRTPPVPALLAEVLANNVGAGRANFAEDAAVAARDLYNFSQCNNSCYMAAAFSSLLRTPAARKYLDETFCPALRSKLGAQQQRDLDMFGGWQYGFPRAFCTLWAAFKTENKGASDKAYRAWKNLFFAKRLRPPGFRRGKQADMDEALPKTLYMLAVPKEVPEEAQVPRGKETAAPPRQTQFHADFGGSAFMNDFGTPVKLAVLRGHGEEETFPAAGRRSWRGSRCIRQMAGLGRENGLRYVPKLDAGGNLLNRGSSVTAQDILDESFLEVESENDTVLRAWREEPVPGAAEECRVDNGRGQVHVVQLTHLPKSGLLPIFVQRTLLGERIDVKVDLPLTVKVKQEYFAEAVSAGHKPSKDNPWQYSLRSFACQAGDLDKGHWYAYAKVGKNWFELNSSNGVHAKKVSGDIRKVLKREQKNIVQIFYERTA